MDKCRLCLSEDFCLISVSECREGLPISVIIMIICPVKIEPCDVLSKLICDQCLEIVLSAYKLRGESAKNDRHLRHCDLIFESDIKEENVFDENETYFYETEQKEEQNEERESSIDNTQVYTCDLCSTAFNSKKLLEEHMLSKHIEPRVDSGFRVKCFKESKRKSLESKHKATNAINQIENHQQISEKDKDRNVEDSSSSFDHKLNLTSEMVHNKSGLAVNCFKASPNRSNAWNYIGILVDSERKPVESEAGNFFCKLCVQDNKRKKFKSSSSTTTYSRHLKLVHDIEHYRVSVHKSLKKQESSNRSCTLCNEAFESSKAYFNHIRLEHSTAEPLDFICHICCKAFAKSYILLKHLRIHEGITYTCLLCPATFSYPEGLKRHEKIHDPSHCSKYQCDKCSNAYAEMRSLKNHMKTVHLNKPVERKHECAYCDMKCVTSEKLRIHVMTHTGEKPFVCQFCSNSYTQKGDLNKHLQRSHVGDDLYKCTIEGCNSSYRYQVQLREHYRIHYV